MSLKQFPSHGKFSSEADRFLEVKDPKAFKEINPRLKAEVFSVDKAWKVLHGKNKHHELQNMAHMSGFKTMSKTDTARIAAASGIKITPDFSIEKAVEAFGRMKLIEFYAFAFFLALFTTITYLRNDFYQGNYVYNTAKNAIVLVRFDTPVRHKNFREISRTEDVWDYLFKGLPQYLLRDGYEANTLQPSDRSDAEIGLLYVLRYNQLIQPIRFRQIRVLPQTSEECEANINIVSDFTACSPVYKERYLDKTTYVGLDNGVLSYQSAKSLDTEVFGRHTTQNYDGGGFVIDIPLLTSKVDMMAKLNDLKRARWIDHHTRTIMIDMVTYNPTNMFYLSVRLTFELLPYGDVRPSSSFRIFKGGVILSQIDQVLYYWLDIIAFALIFLHVLWDLFRIFRTGFRVHFKNAFSWINVAIYAISIYVFVKKFEFVALPAVRALNEVGGKTPSTNVYDYETVGWRYNEIECLTGYIALFCWLKLLDYLKYLNRDMASLMQTCARCAYDCSVWFMMLLIIVLAYSQAFYIAIGPEVDGFGDYGQSLSTMVIWIFNVVDFSQVLSSDQILASTLFLSFQVVYSMLLLNMLIVIMFRSYNDIKKVDYEEPIAAALRKKVHVFLGRIKERIFSMLSVLSYKSAENDQDDEGHEMQMEKLKEEAREETFADEGGEPEIVVSTDTLLEMVNRISQLAIEVGVINGKVDVITKKQRRLSGMADQDIRQGAASLLTAATTRKGSTIMPGHASVRSNANVSPIANTTDDIGDDEEGKQYVNRTVSFAVAGTAFGKFPSRPSSNTSCCNSKRFCFHSIPGMHMQWLPSDWPPATCAEGREGRGEGRARQENVSQDDTVKTKCSSAVDGRDIRQGWTANAK